MALLFIHVAVALAGLVQATYTLATPSRRKLRGTYALLAATIASGTYLVVFTHSSIVSSCISGLVYSAAVLGLSAAAQYRLAHQPIGK